MPEIIVTTRSSHGREGTVHHQERVCARDLESEHFAAQLVERLGWALTDADEAQDREPSEAQGPDPNEAQGPGPNEAESPAADELERAESHGRA